MESLLRGALITAKNDGICPYCDKKIISGTNVLSVEEFIFTPYKGTYHPDCLRKLKFELLENSFPKKLVWDNITPTTANLPWTNQINQDTHQCTIELPDFSGYIRAYLIEHPTSTTIKVSARYTIGKMTVHIDENKDVTKENQGLIAKSMLLKLFKLYVQSIYLA